MNSIFSAQKLVGYDFHVSPLKVIQPNFKKVTIDVCQLYGSNTVFLQQAAHLTGGSYILLERRDALLQYLIVSN